MTTQDQAQDPERANLALLLEQATAHRPHHTALRHHGVATDYAELRAGAGRVATALRALGVRPDEPVAILAERGVAGAAAFFGVLATGAIAVVMNEALRPRQLDHVLEHSGARILVTTRQQLALLPRPLERDPILVDLDDLPEGETASTPPVPRRADQVAQIIYTSGSTGAPKGVVVSHGNLRVATATIVGYLGITPEDRIASLLPFSFSYGMSQLLCSVAVGATLVVEGAILPRAVVRMIHDERVTVLAAVPPLWLRLANGGGFLETRFPDLRVMTNAGGHLPPENVRALRRAHPGCRFYLMYGLTEVLRSTYLPPEEVDRRPGSIGRAVEGAEVFLVDESGGVVEGAGIGELVHRGPTVTLGYWNDPERTAETYRPDPRAEGSGAPVVYSGDLVRRDAEGFLYHLGRKDRIIKTMGFRVGPDEVLDVLYASGEVEEAAVLGEPDPVWGARIAAFVVLTPAGSLERLQAHAARELPRHMRPARFELRDRLPLLPSGKHDLLALL
jgi:amino acid adenylation domain-containing protein